jgi:hypothetical protein
MKMVQKTGAVLWLVFFLAITIGVPLHKHYCGNSLFASGPVKTGCCCETSGEADKGCCTEESSYFSIGEDYLASADHILKLDLSAIPVFPFYHFSPVQDVLLKQEAMLLSGLPPGKVPVYILHGQIVVYG